MNSKWILLVVLIGMFTGIASAGQINREIWDNAEVSSLAGAINWINSHNLTSSDLLNNFDFPARLKDYYVARVWGWLIPPATGEYTFWIASDDDSGLWLSHDVVPVTANSATAICQVTGWTGYQNWNDPGAGPRQRSNPVYLKQGNPYYILAIMREWIGADYLSVAWAGPTIGVNPTIISGNFLSDANLDCNGNGIPDANDIAQGTSQDINDNHIPDECEADCNGNGIPDSYDISQRTSQDCNGNGIPDECDLARGMSHDCNENGIPDECDIAIGNSLDCNGNGIPDECDILQGVSQDCNGNGIPDECEISQGACQDCNLNGVPDNCDIAQGTSQDKDRNGVPDECQELIGRDIGNPTVPGSTTSVGGAFVVKGAGVDIWDSSDQFHFVSLPAKGDCEITARVASITGGTSGWRKCGVMMRETLIANSTHASMFVTGGNGRDFEWRASTGGQTYSAGEDRAALAPYWVRVKREGNVFTGYKSADGVTWTRHGSTTISMSNKIYVGLAVTSHEPGALTTAIFDHVTMPTNNIAFGPVPSDRLVNAKVTSILEWSDPLDYPNAKFDLYFGSQDPAQGGVLQKKISKQDVNSYNPGPLAFGTTYYWRVDTYDAGGVAHTGVLWRFTTAPDCNGNGIEDFLDISNGTSTDLNGNGIPDECQLDVRVEPVVTLTDPSGTSEVRTALPESIAAVVRGGRYYVEIWASDVGAVNTGLTGVYVDAAFCGQTRATELNNGGIFTEFASGTIQAGKVDEFGGSALPSGGGIGPEWVRVGWLTMSADVDIQSCKIELQSSSSGIATLNRGLVNWAYVQLGSRTIQVLPPARSYDLDGDNTIGVGDLSLFAGSWQKTVPPAAVGHDFDCDNFVGVGDLSWFATGWQKSTNNPTILYPACTPPPAAKMAAPPSSLQGAIPPPPAMEDVLYGLALRETQSTKDTATNLPDSVEEIVPDGTYYLEVWASDAGDINTGLTSAYVDLEITPGPVAIATVGHGGIFTQFKGGTVGAAGIGNLGGSTMTQGVGVEPGWVRVAVVKMTVPSRQITFALKPGAWGTAAYGRGEIPWNKIALGSLEYVSSRPWDLNEDSRIDLADFAVLSENWLRVGDQLPGDFDKSGSVTIEDLATFVNHWLEE